MVNIITSNPKAQNASKPTAEGQTSNQSAGKKADIALPLSQIVNYEDYDMNDEINDLVLITSSEM